jgi:hypothetical protein
LAVNAANPNMAMRGHADYSCAVTFSRPLRRWLSGWLAFTVLFTQLAVAAYACPGQAVVAMPCAMTMADGDMPAMDADQPGLCAKHCQPDSPAPDPVHALSVSGPPPSAVLTLEPAVEAQGERAAWTAKRRARDRAPPPPLGVLHCCWRI